MQSTHIVFMSWKGFEELTRLRYSENNLTIGANNNSLKKVIRATYSGVQRSGVAGVVVTLALRVRAAVDSDSGARGELVAAGAQRRV